MLIDVPIMPDEEAVFGLAEPIPPAWRPVATLRRHERVRRQGPQACVQLKGALLCRAAEHHGSTQQKGMMTCQVLQYKKTASFVAL